MKKTVLTFCAVVGLGLGAMAQSSSAWVSQNIGFTVPNRIVRDIEIPSANVAWATASDNNNPTTSNIQDFSVTVDGGNTWTARTIGSLGANHSFSNISALNKDTAWVAMFNNTSAGGGKILKTVDGGVTWTHQSTATFAGPAGFPNIVHMFNANNGWAQGDPNGGYFEMYTTTNGGTTWTRVPQANIPANLSGEYGIVDMYSAVGSDTIYFGTNMGRVYKSVNKGLNWTVTGTTGLATMDDVEFANGNYGLIRDNADLRRTTDGGATWQLVPYTGTFHPNDLAYVPGTTRSFVSGGSSGQSFGTSYSLDGGNTWTDLDTQFGRPTLKFFNKTIGYAGGFSSATGDGILKYTGIVDLTSVTTPTGINNAEFSKHVSVYPNPSNGEFRINLNQGSGSVVNVKAFDALGRNVYNTSDKLEAGVYNANINLSHLGKGIYMLQVQNGENTSVRQIVIQ